MSVFGPLVGVDDVRDATKAHLITWTPAYIAEAARQRSLDPADVPTFRLFEIVGSDDLPSHDQLPALQIECPGILPQRRSGRKVRGLAEVVVRIHAAAATRESTTQMLGLYTAAVRAAMEQHPTLGGFSADVVWQGERIQASPRGERYEAWDGHAVVLFDIAVDPVMDASARPPLPADPSVPPAPLPDATSAHLTVDPQEPS